MAQRADLRVSRLITLRQGSAVEAARTLDYLVSQRDPWRGASAMKPSAVTTHSTSAQRQRCRLPPTRSRYPESSPQGPRSPRYHEASHDRLRGQVL